MIDDKLEIAEGHFKTMWINTSYRRVNEIMVSLKAKIRNHQFDFFEEIRKLEILETQCNKSTSFWFISPIERDYLIRWLVATKNVLKLVEALPEKIDEALKCVSFNENWTNEPGVGDAAEARHSLNILIAIWRKKNKEKWDGKI